MIFNATGFCGTKQCFYSADISGKFIEEIIYFDVANKIIQKSGRKTIGGVVSLWEESLLKINFIGVCGDSIVESSYEDCDDGNNISGDGCNAVCSDEFCGDSIINDSDEHCDDDSTTLGDGCNANCEIEIPVITNSRSIFDLGQFHTCLKNVSSNQLKCFGKNDQGQLGQGNTANISNGVGPSLASISNINLGKGKTVQKVASGGDLISNSNCAILNDGSVKCWGANGSSQLGQNDSIDRSDNPNELGNNLAAISF